MRNDTEQNIHDESKIEVLNKRQNERQRLCLCVRVFVRLGFFMRMCSNSHKQNKKYCNCTQAAASTTTNTATAVTTVAVAAAVSAVKIRIKWQCKCQQQKQCYFTVNELCASVRACVRTFIKCVHILCVEKEEKIIIYDIIRKNHDNIVSVYRISMMLNAHQHSTTQNTSTVQNSIQYRWNCSQRTRDTRTNST